MFCVFMKTYLTFYLNFRPKKLLSKIVKNVTIAPKNALCLEKS